LQQITGQLAEVDQMPNFFPTLSIVVEEADEVVFWIELLIESKILVNVEINISLKEANEILAIVSKARKTMKERSK
jgi:hypothetical protein